MAQQTAVEWLHIEFQKRFPIETSKMYNNNQLSYEDMIIKAKQMEKQQIMDAYNNGENRSAELYYNETYNK